MKDEKIQKLTEANEALMQLEKQTAIELDQLKSVTKRIEKEKGN